MKIAIIGYGKMGKAIEGIAKDRGHAISCIIDENNHEDLENISPSNTDIAIEFSQPDSAFENISKLLSNGVKVVAATTGWLSKYDEVVSLAKENNGTFLYASNFSIGVNLFFKLNQWLAREMERLDGFKASMTEVHHTEKKDAPSGTAITIAEKIIQNNSNYTTWVNENTDQPTKLGIESIREPNVPGKHTVLYKSPLETIEVKHTAHDRKVFAEGVVKVAEWVSGEQGVLTMNDFLNQE